LLQNIRGESPVCNVTRTGDIGIEWVFVWLCRCAVSENVCVCVAEYSKKEPYMSHYAHGRYQNRFVCCVIVQVCGLRECMCVRRGTFEERALYLPSHTWGRARSIGRLRGCVDVRVERMYVAEFSRKEPYISHYAHGVYHDRLVVVQVCSLSECIGENVCKNRGKSRRQRRSHKYGDRYGHVDK